MMGVLIEPVFFKTHPGPRMRDHACFNSNQLRLEDKVEPRTLHVCIALNEM